MCGQSKARHEILWYLSTRSACSLVVLSNLRANRSSCESWLHVDDDRDILHVHLSKHLLHKAVPGGRHR